MPGLLGGEKPRSISTLPGERQANGNRGAGRARRCKMGTWLDIVPARPTGWKPHRRTGATRLALSWPEAGGATQVRLGGGPASKIVKSRGPPDHADEHGRVSQIAGDLKLDCGGHAVASCVVDEELRLKLDGNGLELGGQLPEVSK